MEEEAPPPPSPPAVPALEEVPEALDQPEEEEYDENEEARHREYVMDSRNSNTVKKTASVSVNKGHFLFKSGREEVGP